MELKKERTKKRNFGYRQNNRHSRYQKIGQKMEISGIQGCEVSFF
jgi:hypothetical protein